MFIKFYILKRLGGGNPTRAKIMKTSQIKQVVSSVRRKWGQLDASQQPDQFAIVPMSTVGG